jgi:SAM-dependent methyltransferase
MRKIDRLRQLMNREETHPVRRARLFARFGGPRAAVIKRLTNMVIGFVTMESKALQGARVLDYGCGDMPYLKAFELVGAKVVGADIGENRLAAVRIPNNGRLPLANCSFDYVVSFQVLEHIPIPGDYLAEARRVLRPGGKLFLTTHGIWPYHPTPGDFHRWTRAGLIDELERAGFRTERTGHILNEYSAAVQYFVMNAEYRGAWKWFSGLVHIAAHFLILSLECIGHAEPEIPAVISIQGRKT